MLTLWLLACEHVVKIEDDAGPTVEILRPGAGEAVSGEFSFCARVSDADPLARLERTLFLEEEVIADEDLFGLCEGGNTGVEITLTEAGDHVLRLEVTDTDGNVGSDEVEVSVELEEEDTDA